MQAISPDALSIELLAMVFNYLPLRSLEDRRGFATVSKRFKSASDGWFSAQAAKLLEFAAIKRASVVDIPDLVEFDKFVSGMF